MCFNTSAEFKSQMQFFYLSNLGKKNQLKKAIKKNIVILPKYYMFILFENISKYMIFNSLKIFNT